MAQLGHRTNPYVVLHQVGEAEVAKLNAGLRRRLSAAGKTPTDDVRAVRTLREWRDLLASSGGQLPDPANKRMRAVSLDAFADADPDRTWLQIGFVAGL